MPLNTELIPAQLPIGYFSADGWADPFDINAELDLGSMQVRRNAY